MKQGYIQLLPYMLKFLAGTRKIVRYHDVTPGSQITWNTSFLAVTGAFKRGGEREVLRLRGVADDDLPRLHRHAHQLRRVRVLGQQCRPLFVCRYEFLGHRLTSGRRECARVAPGLLDYPTAPIVEGQITDGMPL